MCFIGCDAGQRNVSHIARTEKRETGVTEKRPEKRCRSVEDGVEGRDLIIRGGRGGRGRGNGRTRRVDGNVHSINRNRGEFLISEDEGLDWSRVSNSS